MYQKIIKPLLYEINIVNEAFQKDSVNIGSVNSELSNFIKWLARKLLKEPFNNNIEVITKALDNKEAFLPLNKRDFVAHYNLMALETKTPDNVRNEVEQRASGYISNLCKELFTRLPDNLEHSYNLVLTCILFEKNRPKFAELPSLSIFVEQKKI